MPDRSSPAPLAEPRRLPVAPLLTILVGLGALAAVRFGLLRGMDSSALAEALAAVRTRPWALPAFFLAYLLLTSALVPAFVLHMAAAVTWGLWPALALNVVACNLAANAQFGVARRLRGAGAARLWSRPKVRTVAELAQVHGLRAMLALRLLPLPTLVVNVGAGLSPLRWRDFLAGTALGTLPFIWAYTYFADAVVSGVAGGERQAVRQALAAAAALFFFSLLPVALRRWRSRKTGGARMP